MWPREAPDAEAAACWRGASWALPPSHGAGLRGNLSLFSQGGWSPPHTANTAGVMGPWGMRNPIQVHRCLFSMCYVPVTAQGLKAPSTYSSRGVETLGTFVPGPFLTMELTWPCVKGQMKTMIYYQGPGKGKCLPLRWAGCFHGDVTFEKAIWACHHPETQKLHTS